MVADEEEGPLFAAEICFQIVMDIIFFVHEKAPDVAEDIVDGIGTGDVPGGDGLGYGGITHGKNSLCFLIV